MPSDYINFVKMHPIQAGESAKDRIKRVAQLWQEYKQGGYSTGFVKAPTTLGIYRYN